VLFRDAKVGQYNVQRNY